MGVVCSPILLPLFSSPCVKRFRFLPRRRTSGPSRASAWSSVFRLSLLGTAALAVAEPVFVATSPNPLFPDANDGLVTVQSARWGTFLGCVPADHLDEVGQIAHLLPDLISGFDHKQLYRRIVDTLHRDGL